MWRRCWKLFTVMLFLSAVTLGGGFAMIPLLQRQFVQDLGWLTEEEVLDITAFARSTPGAATVNVAVQVGMRMAGAAGAVSGALGTVLPPVVILSLISRCYDAFAGSLWIAALLYGMRLSAAAVVSDAAAQMAADILRAGDWVRRAVLIAVFLLLTLGASAVWLLAGSAALGWILSGRRGE